MPNLPLSAAAAALALLTLGHAQSTSTIAHDPAPDKTFPASMQSLQIPSHGALLNAFVYLASGPGPHPVVVLLHGFPGNERNLDLAQAIRRSGWDILYFNYRGSWGTPGDFSFTHSLEDTAAAVSWLRSPAIAKQLRSDPQKIVLLGHSMGGFMAAYAGAQDPSIRAVGMISAANFGGMAQRAKDQAGDAAQKDIATHLAAEGMAPLAGCTPDSLAHELLEHGGEWNISLLGPKLAPRPVLLITSDDGSAPSSTALGRGLAQANDTAVKQIHMPTDHPYSDHRLALEDAVLTWLATLP